MAGFIRDAAIADKPTTKTIVTNRFMAWIITWECEWKVLLKNHIIYESRFMRT